VRLHAFKPLENGIVTSENQDNISFLLPLSFVNKFR